MSIAVSTTKTLAENVTTNGYSAKPVTLEPLLSIYLDILRITAALLVFAYHAKAKRLNGEWLSLVGSFGHDAVIIFFVISGFVIAYSADRAVKQNLNINSFLKGRVARLASVAIPALVFTVIADFIGQHFKPELYVSPYYIDSSPVLRFIYNLLFLNEIWFSSWRAFSNGPFWSLSYEFFYYLLFSAAFYLRGTKRVITCCSIAFVAGPKIILLMPTWLIGVFLYKTSKNLNLSLPIGLLLSVSSICFYILYQTAELPAKLHKFTEVYFTSDFMLQLKFSQWFLNDYIVAMLVAIHILGIAAVSSKINVDKNFGNGIRKIAGMTFTLYLFHYPLLLLYSSITTNSYVVVILTLSSTALISPLTDGQKQNWLNLFDRIAASKHK